jgi:hypothetical protein
MKYSIFKIYGGKYDGYKCRVQTDQGDNRPTLVLVPGQRWGTRPKELVDAANLYFKSGFKYSMTPSQFIRRLLG